MIVSHCTMRLFWGRHCHSVLSVKNGYYNNWLRGYKGKAGSKYVRKTISTKVFDATLTKNPQSDPVSWKYLKIANIGGGMYWRRDAIIHAWPMLLWPFDLNSRRVLTKQQINLMRPEKRLNHWWTTIKNLWIYLLGTLLIARSGLKTLKARIMVR